MRNVDREMQTGGMRSLIFESKSDGEGKYVYVFVRIEAHRSIPFVQSSNDRVHQDMPAPKAQAGVGRVAVASVRGIVTKGIYSTVVPTLWKKRLLAEERLHRITHCLRRQ